MYYIKRVFLVVLILVLSGAGYAFWHFVLMGPRIGEQDVTVYRLAGQNGPRLDRPMGKVVQALSGERMLKGSSALGLVMFVSNGPILFDMPTGMLPKRMRANESWVTFFGTEGGDWLVEAPPAYSPGKLRLALQVDGEGSVVGEYPWVDLVTGRRMEQIPWGEGLRDLFFKPKTVQQPPSYYELVYEGLKGCGPESGWEGYDGCVGVFSYYQSDTPDVRSAKPAIVVMDEDDKMNIPGVGVELVEITPEFVRYRLRLIPLVSISSLEQ